MHDFWRRFGTLSTLNEGEDAGSGGGPAWPDYQVPDGVGAGGEPPQDANPKPAAPTSSGQPSGSAGEPAAGVSSDGTPAPTSGGGAPGTAAAGTPQNTLPVGRQLEELARANSELRTQLTEQGKRLGVIDRIAEAISGPKETVDPRKQALRDRLFDIIPELKDLVGLNLADVKNGMKMSPTVQGFMDRHWENVRQTTMNNVFTTLAPYVFQSGGVEKFSDDQKNALQNSFRDYCLADKTGQRVARYEGGDPKLIEEFTTFYTGLHYSESHRAAVAAASSRATNGARAPRAGRSEATGTPVARPDPKDPDAIHDAAWKHASNALRTA